MLPVETGSPVLPMRFPRKLVRRDPHLLKELSYLVRDVQAHLADALVSFAKEAAGYHPIYAIDWEVLHGLLFPRLQGPRSRVSPSLAAYVFSNSSVKMVLPPGSIIEMLHFAERHFPITQALRGLIDHLDDTGHQSELAYKEILDKFERLVKRDKWSQDLEEGPSIGLPVISEVLGELILGFERLDQLVTSGKLVGWEDMFPGWMDGFDNTHVDTLAARIAAQSYSEGPRTSHSNRLDAKNLAAVMQAHAELMSRDCEGGSKRASGLQFNLRLLTETRPLLELSEASFGDDEIAHRLTTVMARHIDSRRRRWNMTTLEGAAVHAAIRRVYPDVNVALEEAKNQFAQIAQVEADILRADHLSDASPVLAGGMTEEAQERIREMLNGGASRWYLPLRVYIRQKAIEFDDTSVWHPGEGAKISRHQQQEELEKAEVITQHVFSHLLAPSASDFGARPTNNQFKSLGIVVRQEVTGTSLPCKKLTVVSTATEEELYSIIRWQGHQLISLSWRSQVDLEDTLNSINSLLQGFKHQGDVSASFRSDEAMLRLKTESKEHEVRTIYSLPTKKIINIDHFLTTVKPKGGVARLVMAEEALISTAIGDLTISLPLSAGAKGTSIAATIDSNTGVDDLVAPLMRLTHSWRWSEGIVEALITRIRELVNEEYNFSDAL